MLRSFRVRHLSLPSVLLSVLLGAALAALGGCTALTPLASEDAPETLSSKEIYELLSADDDTPVAEVSSARVLSQGLYRSARSQTVARRANGCPNARYLLVQRGREVRAQLGLWLGFEFVLDSVRNASHNADYDADYDADLPEPSLVPLTLVVRHPPYRNPVTGQVVREEVSQFSACLGHTGFAVWRATSDWELVSGTWVCEVQSAGVPVATATFLVRGDYPPFAGDEPVAGGLAQSVGTPPPSADLTVALGPWPQPGTPLSADAAAEPSAEAPAATPAEAPEEVMDFSANKVLTKWVAVPGVRHAPAQPGAVPRTSVRPAFQAQAARRPAPSAPSVSAVRAVRPAPARAAPGAALAAYAGQPGVVVVVSSNTYAANALNEVRALRAKGYPAYAGQYKDPRTGRVWHTVRLEGFASVAQAREAKRAFMRREGRQAFVAVRGSVPNPRASVARSTTPPAVRRPTPPAAKPEPLPAKRAYIPAEARAPRRYSVQVGACLLPESARTMERDLRAKGYAVRIVLLKDAGGKLWHRVLIGEAYADKAAARQAVRAYKSREGKKAYVIDGSGRVVRR